MTVMSEIYRGKAYRDAISMAGLPEELKEFLSRISEAALEELMMMNLLARIEAEKTGP